MKLVARQLYQYVDYKIKLQLDPRRKKQGFFIFPVSVCFTTVTNQRLDNYHVMLLGRFKSDYKIENVAKWVYPFSSSILY